IDKTAPSISGSRTPEGNSNGWNNSDVTVKFVAADTLSGIASVTPDTVVNTEGANQSVTGTAIDAAGNTASTTVSSISIDKTAPAISSSRTTPNDAGWNNTDVTVTFTASDELSGIQTVTSPITLSDEAANQTVTGTVTDKAGNSASTIVSNINIDKTAPFISGSRTPANEYGWNNNSVTVYFTASDTLSSIANVTPDIVVSGEGANQVVSGTAIDKAGNSTSITVDNINIDLTKPTLTFSEATTQPNEQGWYKTDVTVPFTANDDLSGVASSDPVNQIVLYSEGSSITGIVTVTDKAGNIEVFTTSAYKIDRLNLLSPLVRLLQHPMQTAGTIPMLLLITMQPTVCPG
ncbi:MAG: hypothetical protein NTV30_05160, partial [Chloroflexi bacterium]|nr:hypothetical protein [Chloroflexota bacterium]